MELGFSTSIYKANKYLQGKLSSSRSSPENAKTMSLLKGKAWHGKPGGRRRAGWCRSCILSGSSRQIKVPTYETVGRYHRGKPMVPEDRIANTKELHVIIFRKFFTCARSLALYCIRPSKWHVAPRGESQAQRIYTARSLAAIPRVSTELLPDPEAYLSDCPNFGSSIDLQASDYVEFGLPRHNVERRRGPHITLVGSISDRSNRLRTFER